MVDDGGSKGPKWAYGSCKGPPEGVQKTNHHLPRNRGRGSLSVKEMMTAMKR